jgi:hypothetical protein
MRRILVATAAVLALSAVFAGGAGAKCSVSCLNRKVKQLSSALIKAEKAIASLNKTVAQQGQAIAAQNQAIAGLSQSAKFVQVLEKCLFEAPLTQYGDAAGAFGYLFDTGTETVKTTALDITEIGDPIDAWFVLDACNTQTVRTAGVTTGVFPGASSASSLFSGGIGR